MKLKLPKKSSRRQEQGEEIVVLDLSTPITKAVHLRRKENFLTLVNHCSQKAPPPEEDGGCKALAEHFKSLRQALGAKTRETVVVIGMEDSALRNVESPLTDRVEMRHALRFNAKQFFKEDVPDSVFDCFIPKGKEERGEKAEGKADKGEANSPRTSHHAPRNVLVGIGKKGVPARLNSAARLAGLRLTQIVPVQIGLANAALLSKAKLSDGQALVLLHIGSNTSTVSFLSNGTLALTRAIGIGSEHLSKGLAEAYQISASDEKSRISAIQERVQEVLEPVASEVRAAIDYFDHLEGKAVMSGYVTGELAQSNLIIETLKGLEIPCQRLDPTVFLTIEVPEESLAEASNPLKMDLETDLPQLDVAIGAAVSRLSPDAIELNLLVEEIEAEELRQRDPVRWTIKAGVAAALVLMLYAGWLSFQMMMASSKLRQAQNEWRTLEKSHHEALAIFKKVGEMERTMFPLQHHATNRFLWALPLNALQVAMVDEIQVVGLKMEQTLVNVDAVKASKTTRAQPAQTKEQIVLTITAKNFADNHAEDKFIESIASLPYFQVSLRKKEPVLLKNRLLRQVDPLDPARLFTLFTIECVYPERVLGNE
jgi:Tfp pilus assembly PilM family ATPase